MIMSATGHRPNKLGGYGKDARGRLVRIARIALTDYRPDEIVTGMALGWDTAVATAAYTLNIPFIAAVPFKGQEKMWPQDSQDQYNQLLAVAKEIVYVCDGDYAPWKMQKRNEWMVDKADCVLAMWDGSSGGTGNCIAYTKKLGKPFINLWDVYNKKE